MFVVPDVVQIVIVPSPLHRASVPLHGGKQVVIAFEFDATSSAHDAAESASEQASVTSSAANWRRHSATVAVCPHSLMSRLHSFSAFTGRRPDTPPEPDVLADPDDELELLVLLPVPVVPGIGSHAVKVSARAVRMEGREVMWAGPGISDPRPILNHERPEIRPRHFAL